MAALEEYLVDGHYPTTHPCLFIASELDALIVLEACRLHHLPMLCRRLRADERAAIRPGSVFVYEENADHLARWTDGRRWSSSRSKSAFFLCWEIQPDDYDQDVQSKAVRENKVEIPIPKPGGLHKWAYSVQVMVNPDQPEGKRWHLVWYTDCRDSAQGISTIQANGFLRTIDIPAGVYFSRRTIPLPRIDSSRIIVPWPHWRIKPPYGLTPPTASSSTSRMRLGTASPSPSPHSSSLSSLVQTESAPPISLPSYGRLVSRSHGHPEESHKGRVPLPPFKDVLHMIGTLTAEDGAVPGAGLGTIDYPSEW